METGAFAAEELHCRVSSVHDGDSMRVLCAGERRTQAVRLHQIDAPELDQPYGRQARDHLRKLCPKGTNVSIASPGRDQYDRLLGDVRCGDKSVNEEMVEAGAAWVYDRHIQDRALIGLQQKARKDRRGLWAASNPEAPWRWRYRQRRAD